MKKLCLLCGVIALFALTGAACTVKTPENINVEVKTDQPAVATPSANTPATDAGNTTVAPAVVSNGQNDELIETKFKLAILDFWQVRNVFRDPQNKNKFYYVTNFSDGSDIWVYDLSKDKTYQKDGTFNIPEGNTLLFNQKLAAGFEFRGVGIVDNKFVFLETRTDNSSGPCTSLWLSSNLEYINLGISSPTRKSFTVSAELKKSEEQKMAECEKNL